MTLILPFVATPALAQADPSRPVPSEAGPLEAVSGRPPERIDLLLPSEEQADEPEYEDCKPEDTPEARDEIVVCRRKRGQKVEMWSKEDWEDRYAAKTAFRGAPRTPDLGPAYPGVVVARGCFIPPCPKPPAYIIDFSQLPETPPGSDADRVGRGLAPRGNEGGVAPLPPAVTPPGSASPEEQP